MQRTYSVDGITSFKEVQGATINFYRLMPETLISPVNDNDSSYVIFLGTVVSSNEHFIPNGTSGTVGLQRHPTKSRLFTTRL